MNRTLVEGSALKFFDFTRSDVSDTFSVLLDYLTSRFGGIVEPICFVAFKLITSSNSVGCSTGRSGRRTPKIDAGVAILQSIQPSPSPREHYFQQLFLVYLSQQPGETI